MEDSLRRSLVLKLDMLCRSSEPMDGSVAAIAPPPPASGMKLDSVGTDWLVMVSVMAS